MDLTQFSDFETGKTIWIFELGHLEFFMAFLAKNFMFRPIN